MFLSVTIKFFLKIDNLNVFLLLIFPTSLIQRAGVRCNYWKSDDDHTNVNDFLLEFRGFPLIHVGQHFILIDDE